MTAATTNDHPTTRKAPVTDRDTCDASTSSTLFSGLSGQPATLGPCILRHGHDGPVHKDASGATWWASLEPARPPSHPDGDTLPPRCAECGDPITEPPYVREWTGTAGQPGRWWHKDRAACLADEPTACRQVVCASLAHFGPHGSFRCSRLAGHEGCHEDRTGRWQWPNADTNQADATADLVEHVLLHRENMGPSDANRETIREELAPYLARLRQERDDEVAQLRARVAELEQHHATLCALVDERSKIARSARARVFELEIRADTAQARLQLCHMALTADGYFTDAEIGPDIAPRITERLAKAHEAEDAVARVRQLADWLDERMRGHDTTGAIVYRDAASKIRGAIDGMVTTIDVPGGKVTFPAPITRDQADAFQDAFDGAHAPEAGQ